MLFGMSSDKGLKYKKFCCLEKLAFFSGGIFFRFEKYISKKISHPQYISPKK